MSVGSKLTKTFSSPETFPLVSMYRKTEPIGGKDVAPDIPVGEFYFVGFIKPCIFPCFFSAFYFIFHCCKRYPRLFGALIVVVSVICSCIYFLS